MTAAPARIRRAIRYAQMDGNPVGDVREANMHRARMTCSDRLRQPNGQDWSETVGMSPSGRFRVVEDRADKTAPFSRMGVRWDLARWLFALVAVLMATAILVMIASIGNTAIRIRNLDIKIQAATEEHEKLQADIALQDGDVSVCTEAVKLNLVSSQGTKAITLTAPTGADHTPENEETGIRADASY